MSGSSRERQGLTAVLASPAHWTRAVILTATMMAFLSLHPVERLLGSRSEGFSPTPMSWRDALAWLVIAISVQTVWTHLFRREQWRAEKARIRADILSGRHKRMPFAARVGGLLISLLIVLAAEWDWRSGDASVASLLWIGWGALLFFVLQETAILLVPGEALHADRNDELLVFFSSRVLRTGFAAVIVSLAGLSVLACLVPATVALLLPFCLTTSVLVPAVRLRQLERAADAA